MQEALNMTSEEMDIAANQLMLQNRGMGTTPTNTNNCTVFNNENLDNPSSRIQSPQHQKTYNHQQI